MPARIQEVPLAVAFRKSDFPSSWDEMAAVRKALSPAVLQIRQLILKSHESARNRSSTIRHHQSRIQYLMKSPRAHELGLNPRTMSSISSKGNYRKVWGTEAAKGSPLSTSKSKNDGAPHTTDKSSYFGAETRESRKASNQVSREIVPLYVALRDRESEVQTTQAFECSQISKSLGLNAMIMSKISSPKSRGGEGMGFLAKYRNKHPDNHGNPQQEKSRPSILSPDAKQHAKFLDEQPGKVFENRIHGGALPIPRNWTQSQLLEWLQCKLKNYSTMNVPLHVNGKAIMRMSKFQISAILRLDSNQSEFVYNRLRAETDHVERMALKKRAALRKELTP